MKCIFTCEEIEKKFITNFITISIRFLYWVCVCVFTTKPKKLFHTHNSLSHFFYLVPSLLLTLWWAAGNSLNCCEEGEKKNFNEQTIQSTRESFICVCCVSMPNRSLTTQNPLMTEPKKPTNSKLQNAYDLKRIGVWK